jgi:hypothetical protein
VCWRITQKKTNIAGVCVLSRAVYCNSLSLTNDLPFIALQIHMISSFSHYYIMKRTFKQWLSTFPSVSQKRTMASHLNWTHWIQKRRPRPGFNRNTNVARLNQFIGSVTLRYSNSSNIYNENEDIMWICRVIKGKSFVNDRELQYTARTWSPFLYSVSSVKMRGHSSFLWYWWKCWQSLFKCSFHNIIVFNH